MPCGKCAECTRKKQAEFSALSIHQGLVSGSLYMFTLTYRNSSVPVAISEDAVDGPRIIGFERGCDDWLSSDGKFMNSIRVYDENGSDTRCCSLRREDVKLVLKQFRTLCKERDLSLDKFKYAFFGEFGEQSGRPHYHGLCFGLSPIQAKLFSDLWQQRFGFVHCGPVPGTSVSLDDILAMSQYASKYVSKGVYTRWQHILSYVEKPRRQSSINFGGFSSEEISQLASFMMGATYVGPNIFGLDLFPNLFSWIWYRLDVAAFNLLVKHSQFRNV